MLLPCRSKECQTLQLLELLVSYFLSGSDVDSGQGNIQLMLNMPITDRVKYVNLTCRYFRFCSYDYNLSSFIYYWSACMPKKVIKGNQKQQEQEKLHEQPRSELPGRVPNPRTERQEVTTRRPTDLINRYGRDDTLVEMDVMVQNQESVRRKRFCIAEKERKNEMKFQIMETSKKSYKNQFAADNIAREPQEEEWNMAAEDESFSESQSQSKEDQQYQREAEMSSQEDETKKKEKEKKNFIFSLDRIKKILDSKNDKPNINIKLCLYIYGTVIKYIAWPKMNRLREMSLPQQIMKDVRKLIQNINELENIYRNQEVQTKLSDLFEKGIKLNDKIYSQDRVQQARQSKSSSLIKFNPNCIVTSQVFRQILEQSQFDVSITSGHAGISKTFSYLLYQHLSDLFLQKLLLCNKEWVPQLMQQLGLKDLDIPKLFYWSMDITKTWDDEMVIQLFNSQHLQREKQLEKLRPKELLIKYKTYFQPLNEFYNKKNIKIILLVDQINYIASSFRQMMTPNYKKERYKNMQTTTATFQTAHKLNCLRIKVMGLFKTYRVIYNSSANMEILQFGERHIFQQHQVLIGNIFKEINLLNSLTKKSTKIRQEKILYTELMKHEATLWMLTDCIFFELQKLKNRGLQFQRNAIFQVVKRRSNNTIIAPIEIRQWIDLNYQILKGDQNFIQKIFEGVQTICNKNFVRNNEQFKDKIICQTSIRQYSEYQLLKLLTFIRVKKRERMNLMNLQLKKRKTSGLDFTQSNSKMIAESKSIIFSKIEKKIQKRVDELLQFLELPLEFSQKQHESIMLFKSINKQLFFWTKDNTQLQHYLLSLIKILPLSLACEFPEHEQKISRVVQIKYNNLRKIKIKNQFSVVFCFIPVQATLDILEKRINDLITNHKSICSNVIKTFRHKEEIQGPIYGGLFERVLMNTIEEEKKIFKLSSKLQFKIQKRAMRQFQSFPMDKLLTKQEKEEKKKNKQKEQKNKAERIKANDGTKCKYQKNRETEYKPGQKRDKKEKSSYKKRYKQFLNQFLQYEDQGEYMFRPTEIQNSKCIDFVILRVAKVQEAENVFYTLYLFDTTVEKTNQNIEHKVNTFLEAYGQVSKQIKKKGQTGLKKNIYVYYVLVGTQRNILILENYAISGMRTINAQRKENSASKKYQYFSEILCCSNKNFMFSKQNQGYTALQALKEQFENNQ